MYCTLFSIQLCDIAHNYGIVVLDSYSKPHTVLLWDRNLWYDIYQYMLSCLLRCTFMEMENK